MLWSVLDKRHTMSNIPHGKQYAREIRTFTELSAPLAKIEPITFGLEGDVI